MSWTTVRCTLYAQRLVAGVAPRFPQKGNVYSKLIGHVLFTIEHHFKMKDVHCTMVNNI